MMPSSIQARLRFRPRKCDRSIDIADFELHNSSALVLFEAIYSLNLRVAKESCGVTSVFLGVEFRLLEDIF